VEADLGGYLFKKRIARPGGGKSGGYRTILGFRRTSTERTIFLYGFAKNQRANIVGGGLLAKGSIVELGCEQP